MNAAASAAALGAALGAAAALLVLSCQIRSQGPTQPAGASQQGTTAPGWQFPDRRTLTEYPGP